MSNVKFLCTNGSNSSFNVIAKNAHDALQIALNRFDSESDYTLPINVESECGQAATCYSSNQTDDNQDYTSEEMGLNDEY